MNINEPNLQVPFRYMPFAGTKFANTPIREPPVIDIINIITFNKEINFEKQLVAFHHSQNSPARDFFSLIACLFKLSFSSINNFVYASGLSSNNI